MNGPVMLDTSGLVALVVADDRWHSAAVAAYAGVRAARRRLVVTSLTLAELADTLSAVNLRPLASALRDRLFESEAVEIVPFEGELDSRAWQLFRERPDEEWGLTDCAAFVVMEERRIRDALTADHHFRQAGYHCLIAAP